jgi:hypothetical protein
VETFGKIGDGDSLVMNDLLDGADDADVIFGVGGVAPPPERRGQHALLAPAVERPAADVEFATDPFGGIHRSLLVSFLLLRLILMS